MRFLHAVTVRMRRNLVCALAQHRSALIINVGKVVELIKTIPGKLQPTTTEKLMYIHIYED